MKTRFIKETVSKGGRVREKYYVQYKRLLFWHYVYIDGCKWWSYSPAEAVNVSKDYAFKNHKEVVEIIG